MNLHGIVSGMIGAVNPNQSAQLRVCTGYTTGTAGRRVPVYAPDAQVTAQVQDLSQRDVSFLDSLNIQGSQKVMYLSGAVSGMNRPGGKGGDLVTLGTQTWLVTAVLEQWPDWAKVSVTLQNGG
jgi:hypothetical protein